MGDLPPLPAPVFPADYLSENDKFTTTQMRDYGRAAFKAGRTSAQAVPAGMVLVSKRSIEALNEWAGDSQFYPNQPESKLVNPLMHRVMQETDAWLAAAPKGD